MEMAKIKIRRLANQELSRVRHGLIPLMVFTILLGIINLLVVNQKIVLYIFYIPVIFAAWTLPRRKAVSVATLAAVMVGTYAVFLPETLAYTENRLMFWAELAIWGGILMVTAYMVATLRKWTEEALCSLERAYSGVIAIMSKFIQTMDADTEAHCVRVSVLSVCIGQKLGLDREMAEELRVVSLLHDVDKIDISVEILRKAATLSEDKRSAINEHPMLDEVILKPIGGSMLTDIANSIEAHNENYDGSGYIGLKGEAIPIIARIIAVADVFDTLLADRPNRKSIEILKFMDNIRSSSGSKFDPKVVAALESIVKNNGEQNLAGILDTVDNTNPSIIA
jgi:HD-GYP domain-containing protein (c-di-GMP phosphodiesterase class II)